MKSLPGTFWTAIGMITLVIALLVLKVSFEGRAAFQAGEDYLAAGDLVQAQEAWLQAGRWYVPGSGLRDQAAGRLLELARKYSSEGKLSEAVAAYDDIRAIYHSTASFSGFSGTFLDEANREMAGTLARWRLKAQPKEDYETLESRYLEKLRSSELPSPTWSIIMGLSLLGWLGGLGFLAVRFYSMKRRLPVFGASTLLFVVWLVSLWQMGP